MKSKTRKAAGKASLHPLVRPDWTSKGIGCNNSVKYLETVGIVESLIRNDAHMLLSGRADQTARLIVSTLAHKHGFGPNSVLCVNDRMTACEECGEEWPSGDHERWRLINGQQVCQKCAKEAVPKRERRG